MSNNNSEVGTAERVTQNKVIALFQNKLKYTYLGKWEVTDEMQARTCPIEEDILKSWLLRQGHTEQRVSAAITELKRVRNSSSDLFESNKAVYEKLYYGAKVSSGIGENNVTVHYIDWDNPLNNDFGIAEEVSIKRIGSGMRRPDVVLYVNGIALCVLELKKAAVSVSSGIRQNLTYQNRDEIPHFFSTIQLVMAGNETQGLRYGTTMTPEKYYLEWKREPQDESRKHLFEHLEAMCNKEMLLDFIHNFTIFDAGVKKVARQNQYHGIKAAQKRVKEREGGIIWHTQGSGKSLLMVWLAKWILENNPHARVLIVTDRIELDEQIEKNFVNTNYKPFRAKNAEQLLHQLNNSNSKSDKQKQTADETCPSIICTLLHKFRDKDNYDDFIRQLNNYKITDFSVKGELFVFVDECHRSESGRMKSAMDAVLGGTQMYIGFTGTPLLKKDKATSQQIFGTFIHTYKFDEAVRDGVVLDLLYEPRNIENRVVKQDLLDRCFEHITQGMTEEAKRQVKQKWGTVSAVFSSKDRLGNIATDICIDFVTKPRLCTSQGTAMLVAGSIYEAFRFYDIFSKQVEIQGKCAVISSYVPDMNAIRTAGSQAVANEDYYKYDVCRRMLKDFEFDPDTTDVISEFETKIKKMFIEEPGRMKLLIVVDKLLTGFDAPPATYLYIDKKMRDHGLFQAICRVNRLDGESKEYGYIVDYKELFPRLREAYLDFTSDAFDEYEKEDIEGILKDRLKEAKKRLAQCLEKLDALCEPVMEPKGRDDYLNYFCIGTNLDKHAQQRHALYTFTASLVRAFAQIKDEAEEAGYTPKQMDAISENVRHYVAMRDEVKLCSGDYVDMKTVEAEMRQLVDAFVKAEPSTVLTTLNDKTLSELIAANAKDNGELVKKEVGEKNAADAISNNIKRDITEKSCKNPKFYEKLSKLLDDIVKQLKADAISYKEFLQQIEKLAQEVVSGGTRQSGYSAKLTTPLLKALFDNAPESMDDSLREHFAEVMDSCITDNAQPGFEINTMKERKLRKAIRLAWGEVGVLPTDDMVEMVFNLAKSHVH